MSAELRDHWRVVSRWAAYEWLALPKGYSRCPACCTGQRRAELEDAATHARAELAGTFGRPGRIRNRAVVALSGSTPSRVAANMAGVENAAPIVVIGDPRAVDHIERQLGAAEVDRPVMLFTSLEDGRDFLTAACVAAPVDDRYIPCLILVDGGMASDEKEAFARWARRQAALAETRLVLVDAHGAEADAPAHYDRLTRHAGPQRWRELITHVCE